MSVVQDGDAEGYAELQEAAQARRILRSMSKARHVNVFRVDLSDWPWRAESEGAMFRGVSLEDALAQLGQWLEARGEV